MRFGSVSARPNRARRHASGTAFSRVPPATGTVCPLGLRYDNEAGKGDHRHIGRAENSYQFADPETLLTAAWSNSG